MNASYKPRLCPSLRAALAAVALLATIGTTLLVDGLARHYQAEGQQATRAWPSFAAVRPH